MKFQTSVKSIDKQINLDQKKLSANKYLIVSKAELVIFNPS